MAVTSLPEVEETLAKHGVTRGAGKTGCLTYHIMGHNSREKALPDGLIVFLSVTDFYRHASVLTPRNTVLILDGPFSLLEVSPITVLDTAMTCPAEVACAPSFDRPLWVSEKESGREDKLREIMRPVVESMNHDHDMGPVTVKTYRMKAVSNVPHAMVNGGLYQDVMTVVFNHGDPALQRRISQYVLDTLTKGKRVTKEKVIRDIGEMAPTNPTRASFIERMADTMTGMEDRDWAGMISRLAGGKGTSESSGGCYPVLDKDGQDSVLLLSSLSAITGRRIGTWKGDECAAGDCGSGEAVTKKRKTRKK